MGLEDRLREQNNQDLQHVRDILSKYLAVGFIAKPDVERAIKDIDRIKDGL